MRGDGATHCRSPESPWLSIVLVDALWSPAVTTRLAPAAPGRPQPAQVLDRRSEHEHSAAPPIRRSRPRCFTPRWRGAPQICAAADRLACNARRRRPGRDSGRAAAVHRRWRAAARCASASLVLPLPVDCPTSRTPWVSLRLVGEAGLGWASLARG